MRFALLVSWIAVIFFLGSGQGSMAETSRFIRPLLEFLFPAASEELLAVYHGVIRKFAHIAEYAVLGVLAYRAFSVATPRFVRSRPWLPALLLVAATAVTDEFIQSFIESRTSSPRDVAIDLAGGAAAVTACYVAGRFAARRSASAAS
jgi:VanZ family protein